MTKDHMIEHLRDLLSEVSHCFTRDDDLPDNLLSRIDVALTVTSPEPAVKLIPTAEELAVPQLVVQWRDLREYEVFAALKDCEEGQEDSEFTLAFAKAITDALRKKNNL